MMDLTTTKQSPTTTVAFRFRSMLVNVTNIDAASNILEVPEAESEFKSPVTVATVSFQERNDIPTTDSKTTSLNDGETKRSKMRKSSSKEIVLDNVAPPPPSFDDPMQIYEYLQQFNYQNIKEIKTIRNEEYKAENLKELTDFLRLTYRFINTEKLSIVGNNLLPNGKDELKALLQTVKATLRELDVSDNPMKLSGLEGVIDILQTHDVVQRTSSASLHQLDQIEDNNDNRYHFIRLDLSNVGLVGVKAGSLLASMLRTNYSIQELIIANNRLGDRGIKALASGLSANNSLRKLNVSRNDLSDKGIRTLLLEGFHCDAWYQSSVEELDISCQPINWDINISNAFLGRPLKALSKLNLSFNSNGYEASTHYATLLRFSYTLIELNLSHNNLRDKIHDILDAIQANHNETCLQKLDVSWNNINDEGSYHIAEMIQGNTSLECLIVSHNDITDIGIGALAAGLMDNTTLVELNIIGNQIRNLRSICSYIVGDNT